MLPSVFNDNEASGLVEKHREHLGAGNSFQKHSSELDWGFQIHWSRDTGPRVQDTHVGLLHSTHVADHSITSST